MRASIFENSILFLRKISTDFAGNKRENFTDTQKNDEIFSFNAMTFLTYCMNQFL